MSFGRQSPDESCVPANEIVGDVMDSATLDLLVTISFGASEFIGELLRIGVNKHVGTESDKAIKLKHHHGTEHKYIKRPNRYVLDFCLEPFAISIPIILLVFAIVVIYTSFPLSPVYFVFMFEFSYGILFGSSHWCFEFYRYSKLKGLIKESITAPRTNGYTKTTGMLDSTISNEIRQSKTRQYYSKAHENSFVALMLEMNALEKKWLSYGIIFSIVWILGTIFLFNR